MENTVKQRLKIFLEKNNVKETDFCKLINVSQGYISGMRKSIQPDKIKSIAINYPELNIAWLLTGIGNMQSGKNAIDECEIKDKDLSAAQHRTIETQARTIETLSRTIETLTQKPN